MADSMDRSPSLLWQPLLQGEEAVQAWQAIDAVAAELQPVEKILPLLHGASLSGGSAGLALFFTYLAMARDDSSAADVAVTYFDHAVDTLTNTVMTPGLYSGFSGVAWLDTHLEGRLFSDEETEGEGTLEKNAAEDDELSSIDEGLLTLLQAEPWSHDYDLVGGLVGYGVYGLEGGKRQGPQRCLERVIEQLADLAITTASGLTWFTPANLLPSHQAEAYPKGYYNLGMAHGVPAVAAVLGRACRSGVATEVAYPLLHGAVSWLLAQQLEAGDSCFTNSVIPEQDAKPSRLAWCYGDPGVAVAVLGAALAVGNEAWQDKALAIAKRAAARPLETARVEDPGLCHGSAGLGHVFHRMAWATGDAELAQAARFWFAETLGYWHPGRGLGGFRAWKQAAGKDERSWQDDPGFLTGSAGIAMSLLAAVSEVEPEWDRLLLTDLPVLHKPV